MDPINLIIRVFKLLLPFIVESFMGKDSFISFVKKRKVFTFVVISNIAMFATIAFLAEQNFIFLETIRGKNSTIMECNTKLDKANQYNTKLLELAKGDLDSICYAHLEEQFKPQISTTMKSKEEQEYTNEP